MHIRNLASGIVSAVLFVGLTSCAKSTDETRKDVFRPPTPEINQAQGKVDFNQTFRGRLDLYDKVDFSRVQSISVDLKTVCRRGQKREETTIKNLTKSQITVYELIPEVFVYDDMANQDLFCSFEMVMTNSIGSKNLQIVNDVQVGDSGGSNVIVYIHGDGRQPEQILFDDLKSLRLQFSPIGAHRAQLKCQDFSLAPKIFEGVLSVRDFDQRPELNPSSAAGSLDRRPLQGCRIWIRSPQTDSVEALSRRFVVIYPRASMPIKLWQRNYAPLAELHPSLGVTFTQYVFENPSAVPRQIRFSKKLILFNIAAFSAYRNQRYHGGFDGYWGQLISDAPVAEETFETRTVSIPPGQQSFMTVLAQAPGPVSCSTGGVSVPVSGVMLVMPHSLSVEELTETGQWKVRPLPPPAKLPVYHAPVTEFELWRDFPTSALDCSS